MKRKHFTQFSKDEKAFIESIRRDLKINKFSDHTKKRIREKFLLQYFDENDYKEAMLYGQVIEVADYGHNDIRLVFRSLTSRNSEHLVFSYSIKNRVVVTAWTNHERDNHGTIDYTQYTDKMDVSKTLLHAMKYYRRKDKKVKKMGVSFKIATFIIM